MSAELLDSVFDFLFSHFGDYETRNNLMVTTEYETKKIIFKLCLMSFVVGLLLMHSVLCFFGKLKRKGTSPTEDINVGLIGPQIDSNNGGAELVYNEKKQRLELT